MVWCQPYARPASATANVKAAITGSDQISARRMSNGERCMKPAKPQRIPSGIPIHHDARSPTTPARKAIGEINVEQAELDKFEFCKIFIGDRIADLIVYDAE